MPLQPKLIGCARLRERGIDPDALCTRRFGTGVVKTSCQAELCNESGLRVAHNIKPQCTGLKGQQLNPVAPAWLSLSRLTVQSSES